jgi:hypothetical protein
MAGVSARSVHSADYPGLHAQPAGARRVHNTMHVWYKLLLHRFPIAASTINNLITGLRENPTLPTPYKVPR